MNGGAVNRERGLTSVGARLVRLRERGKQRRVTLIPFDAVAKFIREQMTKAKGAV